MKRVELWNESVDWGSDLGDGTLVSAIAKLNEMAGSVPEEYLPSVKFEFEDVGYDQPSTYLKIWYDRPYTAEEIEADRRAGEERAEALKLYTEHQERATLAVLKAKYEAQ